MSESIPKWTKDSIQSYLANPLGYLRGLVQAEQGFKPSPNTLFGSLPVLTGGTKTYEVATLSQLELARLLEFLDYLGRKLEKSSVLVAEDFKKQIPFFVDVASYAKARFDNKPFNEDEVAELPGAGQIGAQALISQDMRATGEAALHNNWDVAVVAGTENYIFGTAALWYLTSATVEQRAVIAIMKNGVIESGTTPSINQLHFRTQTRGYPPWRADILVDAQVETDKPVYQYHTPGAIILTPDLGARLSFMPTRTETISPRLVGVVFAEYTYLAALRWN